MAPQQVLTGRESYTEYALQEVRQRRLLIDRYDAWLLGLVQPCIGQRVLEVGCGLGNLMRHLLDRELVVGVDVSEQSVQYVNSFYCDHPNVLAVRCDVLDPSFLALRTYEFDTAVSLNVLEHIMDDAMALRNISEVLIERGRLILILPAHMSLYGSMDSSIGHYRRYNRSELASRLEMAGFRVEFQRYVNLLGAVAWLVNGRFLRREVPSVSQLRLFNVLMPIVSAVEGSFSMPFGLSLLSVSARVD